MPPSGTTGLVLLTCGGCVTTAPMRANLDEALRSSSVPTDYRCVDLGDPSSRRSSQRLSHANGSVPQRRSLWPARAVSTISRAYRTVPPGRSSVRRRHPRTVKARWGQVVVSPSQMASGTMIYLRACGLSLSHRHCKGILAGRHGAGAGRFCLVQQVRTPWRWR